MTTTIPGLYDPRFEHASCGLGCVARLDGNRSHEIVTQALTVLDNLEHRGATGADPETGDGAGIMTQIPDGFMREVWLREHGFPLPAMGEYAVGVVFLPHDPDLRLHCEELFARIVAEEGHRAMGWRDVPVRSESIGELARRSEPAVRQLFVQRREGDDAMFSRKLAVIRRRVQLAASHAGIPSSQFSVVSLSQHTLVLKGLFKASQLRLFYPDLEDSRFTTGMAIVHSRFSTNTLGSWDLAHPFNLLAHNGEINTIRANHNWLVAREPQLRSALLGGDLQKLFPIAEERWSDSARLDAMLGLLVLAGRSVDHALAMLVPPAWTDNSLELSGEVRAFHEYNASLVEPWDGPAALIASDGMRVVASLDRNGLRPLRFTRTSDGLVVIASETGVLPIEDERIVEAGRLGPGGMLVLDMAAGELIHDREIKSRLAGQRPYGQWISRQTIHLDDLPECAGESLRETEVLSLQQAFGYTSEELRLLIAPMAADGREPVGSMGDDTPLAALSERARLLPAYFKQQFAQVTNPPIDPQWERLVMSLRTSIGAMSNLLDQEPDSKGPECRRVVTDTPILSNEELAKVRRLDHGGLDSATLQARYPVGEGARGLEAAVDALCHQASQLVWDGATILILSDRGISETEAAIPSLIATAAVHSHLVREGARTMCSLVVESAEPRESMHIALLLGYGAAVVNPYLALDTVQALHAQGRVASCGTPEEACANYLHALELGVLKVCSRMGISTVQSYRGAQIFEAVGLGRRLIDRYFPGTVSRVGGLELADLHVAIEERHARAFGEERAQTTDMFDALDGGGEYQLRRRGEHHAWNPDTIVSLQRAARSGDREAYRLFADQVEGDNSRLTTLRGLLELKPAPNPIPIDEVDEAADILKRFVTGAMSLGSLSPEAHETIAIAVNRIGARSNTGEGGEDPARSLPLPNGDRRRSAIKQVASGRFGVTTSYLVDADQIQIKIAQGAKPGEGGQLPGHKVDETIARLRHATPGVGLISPPPHHDVYSIEDLAQLIHDLRCVNPTASISVKLVSQAGVGTVAAGVAKSNADHIVIAGHDGGTGASPLSSLKHVGLPWEIGLAETHQVLVANGLRERVRLQVDGGLRTGRDIVVAALLGADEFAFGTAPLIALGCVMMRVCHLNTCPVGIATQDPVLRRRFAGTPEDVIRYLYFTAEHVRELMATVGVRRFGDLTGRTSLLTPAATDNWPWLRDLDLGPLLEPASPPPDISASRNQRHVGALGAKSLEQEIIREAQPALDGRGPVSIVRQVKGTDLAVGVMLAGEICRQLGPDGLPPESITLSLTGTGGQSFGAFAVKGVTLNLVGTVNDYAGKGLSGGRLIVRPPNTVAYVAELNVVAGNVLLYGATAGEAFFRGRAGDRFCVRNSGATAVVEGVGDHGCEYMTGGTVVILGPTGRNFAAGMSGGIAYVLDHDGRLASRCNHQLVELQALGSHDVDILQVLLIEHAGLTDSSVAKTLLQDWPAACNRFVAVIPHDVRHLRDSQLSPRNSTGTLGEELASIRDRRAEGGRVESFE